MYSGLDCINRLWHKLNEAIFNLDLAITGKLGNFSRMWHVMEINIHVRFCRFSPTESAMSPESPTSRHEQPGISRPVRYAPSNIFRTHLHSRHLFLSTAGPSGAIPHNSPMGKFSCPRASTWQRRAKDCLTRPRRVPCLCHRRHRSSTTVCEAWFLHVSKVCTSMTGWKCGVRMARMSSLESRDTHRSSPTTQHFHVMVLQRPSATSIADVLKVAVRTGILGKPLQRQHGKAYRLQHFSS
jgi:hypothetical protein